jgi:hypothetical protein
VDPGLEGLAVQGTQRHHHFDVSAISFAISVLSVAVWRSTAGAGTGLGHEHPDLEGLCHAQLAP